MAPKEISHHREFLRCFTANEPAMRAYVRRLVPLRADADDVMQEVAVVLWEKFEQFREGGDFRAWAFGVARFEVLAWLRDKGRDRLVLCQDVAELLAEETLREEPRLARQREALESCLEKLDRAPTRTARCRLSAPGPCPGGSCPQRALGGGVLPVAVSDAEAVAGLRPARTGHGGSTMNIEGDFEVLVNRYMDGRPPPRRCSVSTRDFGPMPRPEGRSPNCSISIRRWGPSRPRGRSRLEVLAGHAGADGSRCGCGTAATQEVRLLEMALRRSGRGAASWWQ